MINNYMSASSPTILRAMKNEVPVCVPSQSHRVHSFYCYCVRILFNCAHTQICTRIDCRLGFKKLFPNINIKQSHTSPTFLCKTLTICIFLQCSLCKIVMTIQISNIFPIRTHYLELDVVISKNLTPMIKSPQHSLF